MIKVKKNAIKYKDTDGQMQNIDIMCQIGALSGKESFWDMQTSIAYAFTDVDFGGSVELEIPIGRNLENKVTTNGSVFYQAFRLTKGVKRIKIINYLTSDKAQSLMNMFSCEKADYELEVIDIASVVDAFIVSSFTTCFRYRCGLHSIIGTLDFSGVTSANNMINLFQYCAALKEVRFKQNTINYNLSLANSPLLSDKSIQSIIDGLVTVETQQTLTLHADVKSKLTENQLTTITNKNWVLA